MTQMLPLIVYAACHAGPAGHFAAHIKELKSCQVEVLATGPALKIFNEQGIAAKEFNVENLDINDEANQAFLAERISQMCQTASKVFTDVGHPLMQKTQKSLSEKNPEALNIAYYDNPEPDVPFYTATAVTVMKAARSLVFANSHLANSQTLEKISPELKDKPVYGLGYYPIEKALPIKAKRSSPLERASLREEFFKKHGLEDTHQKILVYFGGNNEAYFQAFETCLELFSQAAQEKDLSGYLLVLQQHPGAQKLGRDAPTLQRWLDQKKPGTPAAVLSTISTDQAKVLADIGLYQQTSMNGELSLAGLPLIQISDKPYADLLIKEGLCPSATSKQALLEALEKAALPVEEERIKKAFGYLPTWQENLLEFIHRR